MFLDPDKPLVTCVAETCDGCPVRDKLHCHFRARDLLHFLAVVFPAFLAGGVGISRLSGWLLLPWLVIVLGYFGLVEIRVMCSHCPHYAEAGMTLKCWANYGSPKLWKYRPGPMSRWEKAVFWAGLAMVLGYPLVCLVVGTEWLWLVVFAVSTVGACLTMERCMCSQCMNLACPLNRVGEKEREAFFDRNPGVAEAWRASGE